MIERLYGITRPLKCKNVVRIVDHITLAFKIGYSSMDQKESTLYDQLVKMSSSGEFLEAVRSGNIAECERILEKKPHSIVSCENKNENQGAVHIAVGNKDYEMLKFLRN